MLTVVSDRKIAVVNFMAQSGFAFGISYTDFGKDDSNGYLTIPRGSEYSTWSLHGFAATNSLDIGLTFSPKIIKVTYNETVKIIAASSLAAYLMRILPYTEYHNNGQNSQRHGASNATVLAEPRFTLTLNVDFGQ